jgi:opacity protein-like surface antigen
MKRRVMLLGLGTAAVLAVHGEFARAQARSQDVQVYAGYVFGDHLLEKPLSGNQPRLDDSATFGARYGYHLTPSWGIQLSAGYSPSRAAHVPNGASNLGLTTVDLDLEWDIVPGLDLAGHPLIPYTVIGVGYAWANFDHSMYGLVNGRPATISDSYGYTANAGLGAKYYLRDNIFIAFDTRYRYLSKLISEYGQELNTAETTLSLGYRF